DTRPTYFHTIHGWGVQITGILSGVPHLVRMVFAYFFQFTVIHCCKKNSWGRTNVRKFACFISIILNGVFVIGLAYSGCSSTTAVVFLILATGVYGAVTAGLIAAVIDMSPNFSGIILGLNGLVCVTPGFISPFIVVEMLTYENQSTQQWQYIFSICATILFITGSIYLLYSDSTLQSWNQPKTLPNSTNDKEMEIIKKCHSRESEVNRRARTDTINE
ncbi:sialin-like, partial [Contarinia nasturtii]|uniref:sialin-like n=1 Tax=Contarinia nasturtii TaxID=265458 RepID=UPI0012D3C76C